MAAASAVGYAESFRSRRGGKLQGLERENFGASYGWGVVRRPDLHQGAPPLLNEG